MEGRVEMEVRAVGGIENCFVSLPLHLLHALQSTRSSPLPPLLPLELRLHDRRWNVAWSGSTSSSSAIEIDRVFAESISLPDRTVVQVRVLSNVSKATLVTVEPDTEDDWEVLELNSELAEAAVLKQVRIVHETMRFPLWLRGGSVITFVVVSTFPPKAVVQLVPGCEVAVAPKRRKKNVDTHDISDVISSNKGSDRGRALLRVQGSESSVFQETNINGFQLRIALTSVVFINPETAHRFSLKSLQLVSIAPRLSLKDSRKTLENKDFGTRSGQSEKELSSGKMEKNEPNKVIVRLLFSDSVAKGHVIMAQSLRHYLRVGVHSWVYLKGCHARLKKEIPQLSLSPCHFKLSGQEMAPMIGSEFLEKNSRKTKARLLESGSTTSIDGVDWSIHEEVIVALSSDAQHKEREETFHQSENRKGLECLVRAWIGAQLQALASASGVHVNTLILGMETLLYFEVKGNKSCSNENVQAPVNGFSGLRDKKKELPLKMSYIMALSEESIKGDEFSAYEFNIDENCKNGTVSGVDLLVGALNFGNTVSLYSVKERNFAKGVSSDVSSLSWMGPIVSEVIRRMTVLLSAAAGIWFADYNLPFPGHVLIYGPAGSGKTLLARATAKYLEEHKNLLAHVNFLSCSSLALEKVQTIRQVLSSLIFEALEHAPSIVIFDDLDSLISTPSDLEGSQPPASGVAVTKFLIDVIDEFEEKRKSSCGIGPIAFMASVQSLDNIPESLRSSGRFDFHVQLAALAAAERGAMLKHEIQKRSLECSDDTLQDVAAKCEGYDAYDLEIVVDRAVHAAIGRLLPYGFGFQNEERTLVREDFSQAMHDFVPVAMRDITKSASEGGRSGWDDVGGLNDIQNAIKEMIEFPSKFPNIFAKAPLRLRSNMLLYGPPGCGKTHIVGAAAAACSLRFISVKGPELLNKYIGASEQAVRDIFAKAAAAAPCLLFFDEFDSIAPKRGHDNTGVTDRVVNQFLTELDGVEVLAGVFVFAATSRPDLLDAALLRPGRLDRLLFCDFPSQHDRLEILTVLSRKLPIASDVNLHIIAQMTEGFSGADLQALLSDAQLAAVHEFLERTDVTEPGKVPVITDALLRSIALKARPSVSETEKQRLYGIYGQFLNARSSIAAQARDMKGKKATLA